MHDIDATEDKLEDKTDIIKKKIRVLRKEMADLFAADEQIKSDLIGIRHDRTKKERVIWDLTESWYAQRNSIDPESFMKVLRRNPHYIYVRSDKIKLNDGDKVLQGLPSIFCCEFA